MLSDGLACFRSVTSAGCSHEAIVTGGKHLNDLPQFRWNNTLLGNLKTSLSGTFHAFNFDKYARRYLGGYCFRFNRRFSLAAITERIANAVCCSMPCTERALRDAESYGQSREILNDFCRCSCREKVFSQRWAVLFEIPFSAARERVLHCVEPSVGLVCRARLITSATLVVSIGLGPA